MMYMYTLSLKVEGIHEMPLSGHWYLFCEIKFV